MRRRLLALCLLVTAFGMPARAEVVSQRQGYNGVCEASAAVGLDDRHFAVASDETNVIHVYRRGVSEPVGSHDFEDFTDFDKSDLEAAARIDSRIYWLSSHSLNKNGKDVKKRKLLFATDIKRDGDTPVLEAVGKPYLKLRDALAAAAGVTHAELNIEGLAAGQGGQLLIGLRSPLREGRAILLPLENPAAVVEAGEAPRFGKPLELPLGDLGIRSIDRVGTGARQYLIVAGPVEDRDTGFKLFWWSGVEGPDALTEIADVALSGLKPEAAFSYGNPNVVQLLSDDGDLCDEEGPVEKRRFRALEIEIR